MTTALNYFKEVYGDVPGWVQKMHTYKPEMLEHYTALRSSAMSPGVLSVKEKDILLVSMNAARLYARSMVYHSKGAIDGGATIQELVEYLTVSYLVGGEQALQLSLQSYEFARKYLEVDVPEIHSKASAVTIMNHFATIMESDEQALYFTNIAHALEQNEQVETLILRSNIVPSRLKYLAMIGSYTSKLMHDDVEIWSQKARENDVAEAEIAELGFICLLTAGIPAWFELSDALI